MKSYCFFLLILTVCACTDNGVNPDLIVVGDIALKTSDTEYTMVPDTARPGQYYAIIPWVYTNLTDTVMEFDNDRCLGLGVALYQWNDGKWTTVQSDHWGNPECAVFPAAGNYAVKLEAGQTYTDTSVFVYGTLNERWQQREGRYRMEILRGELLPSLIYNIDSMKLSNEFVLN